MTRYGKTRCVAIGILLYTLFNKNKRILLLAPTISQANILRNYIAEQITDCELLQTLLDIEVTGIDKLKKEVSRKRLTFKNGIEITVLTAEGTANRLMGFGGDVIIIDESCLVSYEVYRSKISRMLGDNPNSSLIELCNPWHKDNQTYEHWIDPNFKKIHVGWETALEEGRISQAFLDEQRELLKSYPMEFKVLYDSEFPDEDEDSLFKLSSIMAAVNKFTITNPEKSILSCDVADKGRDLTVIYQGLSGDRHYAIEDVYTEAKSESMTLAKTIIRKQGEKSNDTINIDCIGLGTGVVSRVKELQPTRHTTVNGCHFGEAPKDKTRFLNKKAENYFKLRILFEEGLISIPDNKELIRELTKMKWERTQSEKIKIIDPEDKSPDYCDALVYFVWDLGSSGSYSMA